MVSRSADAARDAARALKAKGITGELVMCDGKTGRPRYMVDIEKAAGMTVEENRRMALASESIARLRYMGRTAPKQKQPEGLEALKQSRSKWARAGNGGKGHL